MERSDNSIIGRFVPEQTCSVELDEWLKRMKSDKSAHKKYHPEIRRNPERYRGVKQDS